MILAVSIVDKHAKPGKRHVGTYFFEIPRENNSHFDTAVVVCDKEKEEAARPLLGRFLTKDEIPHPVNLDGEPLSD